MYFSSQNFVLTSIHHSDLVERIIREKGGVIRSSTVLDTNYLIYGEGGKNTKKYERAIELIGKGKPIKLMSETEFFAEVFNKDKDTKSILCVLSGDQVKGWCQKLTIVYSSIPLSDAKKIFEVLNCRAKEYARAHNNDMKVSYAGLDGLADEIIANRKRLAKESVPKEYLILKSDDEEEDDDTFGVNRNEEIQQIIQGHSSLYGNLQQYEISDYPDGLVNTFFSGYTEEYYWIDMTRVSEKQYKRYAHSLPHHYVIAELFAPGNLSLNFKDEDTVSIFGTGKFEALYDFSYGC